MNKETIINIYYKKRDTELNFNHPLNKTLVERLIYAK